MSEPKWREEDDPEVLAAAVAAGVEVQCVAVDGRTWETGCDDSASFRRCMANDCRYRLPVSWQWEPCATDPCEACAERAKAAPEPPFEGAVPTGRIVDGEPTFYCMAGEVPAVGWEMRGTVATGWRQPSWWTNSYIVEARRVPAPATERVPWWEAVGRRWPDGRTVWKVTHSVEGVIAWDNGGEALDVLFSADGTVEVLVEVES